MFAVMYGLTYALQSKIDKLECNREKPTRCKDKNVYSDEMKKPLGRSLFYMYNYTEHCSVWSYQFYRYYRQYYGYADEKGRFLNLDF